MCVDKGSETRPLAGSYFAFGNPSLAALTIPPKTVVADIVASHEKSDDCNIAYHIEYPNDILKDFLAGSAGLSANCRDQTTFASTSSVVCL
jgi:hypothetical protein